MTIMTNQQFVQKLLKMRETSNSYVYGAFGHVCTESNLNRLLSQYPENSAYISAAKRKTFCWDCSGMIKSALWGFNFDSSQVYSGAQYCSNGVSDMNVDGFKAICSSVSTNFSNIMPGELLFTDGHIGVAINSTPAIECTPSWANGIQLSAIGNVGTVAGLLTRTWQCHGKLDRFISYTSAGTSTPPTTQYKQAVPARYFSKSYAKEYTVNANIGVNIRTNAGTNYSIIKAIPYGSKVQNWWYYNVDSSGNVWLYIQYGNIVGYIKKEFLT